MLGGNFNGESVGVWVHVRIRIWGTESGEGKEEGMGHGALCLSQNRAGSLQELSVMLAGKFNSEPVGLWVQVHIRIWPGPASFCTKLFPVPCLLTRVLW